MLTLQTRFLWPFFFAREQHRELFNALNTLQFATRKGDKPVWQVPDLIPHFYRDEFAPQVTEFLFSCDYAGMQYASLNPELKMPWFGRGLHLSGIEDPTFEVQLEQHTGIELFLLPEGVGLLSITLATQQDAENPAALVRLKQFNYKLSQRLAAKTPKLNKILTEQAAAHTPQAADDAPLVERLSHGAFSMVELADYLLQPLARFALHFPQQQFSVYSVLRVHREVDFNTERDTWRPLLASLTHVEEPNHAGSLELTEQQLNSRHWAAVGSLGAAQLIADQGAEISFNEERQLVNLQKYFISYWMASGQRLVLRGILREALHIMRDSALSERNKNQALQALHNQVLHFMLSGYVSEISSREAHNQYYTLARNGLRVKENFETVRSALHDADIKINAEFQCENLENQSDNLEKMKTMQSKLEWLEVFFASYYAGALIYYISSNFFYKSYTGGSVFGWAILVAGVALWSLKPWRHEPSKLTWYQVLSPVALLFVLWFAAGLAFFAK